MPSPGEVNQEIGKTYLHVFIAALKTISLGFENKFVVYTEPEKTTFKGRSGKSFSFDFSGFYAHPIKARQVFGESKGHTRGASLLAEFRAFLAKSYVVSTDYQHNRDDFFWFVTNVPFGCAEGSGIRSFQFIKETLTDKTNKQLQEIFGEGHIDNNVIRSLDTRLGVFILTDSFLMNTDLSYKVARGDTLWSILRKFHGGIRQPWGLVGTYSDRARFVMRTA